MKLGRITHLAVFEPERFRSEVVVYEDRRYGKEWDKFEKAHAAYEIVKPAQLELARSIGEAARRDARAVDLLSKGKAEQTLLWSWPSGIESKGRIDFLAERGIVDLKTCKDASPEAFGRQAGALSYHAQAAWYRDAYEVVTGKRVPFFIVAVETVKPHAVCVYRLSDDLLEAGQIVYEPLLERLAECRKANHWPGYSEGIESLQLPVWALPSEEDYDGLGLTGSAFKETADAF